MRVRKENVHATAVHAEIRADVMRWKALPLVGFQETFDSDDLLELRNCTCGSTLGRRIRRQGMKFKIHEDEPGKFRWSLHAVNDEIIADSGQRFMRRVDVEIAIAALQTAIITARVVDA